MLGISWLGLNITRFGIQTLEGLLAKGDIRMDQLWRHMNGNICMVIFLYGDICVPVRPPIRSANLGLPRNFNLEMFAIHHLPVGIFRRSSRTAERLATAKNNKRNYIEADQCGRTINVRAIDELCRETSTGDVPFRCA